MSLTVVIVLSGLFCSLYGKNILPKDSQSIFILIQKSLFSLSVVGFVYFNDLVIDQPFGFISSVNLFLGILLLGIGIEEILPKRLFVFTGLVVWSLISNSNLDSLPSLLVLGVLIPYGYFRREVDASVIFIMIFGLFIFQTISPQWGSFLLLISGALVLLVSAWEDINEKFVYFLFLVFPVLLIGHVFSYELFAFQKDILWVLFAAILFVIVIKKNENTVNGYNLIIFLAYCTCVSNLPQGGSFLAFIAAVFFLADRYYKEDIVSLFKLVLPCLILVFMDNSFLLGNDVNSENWDFLIISLLALVVFFVLPRLKTISSINEFNYQKLKYSDCIEVIFLLVLLFVTHYLNGSSKDPLMVKSLGFFVSLSLILLSKFVPLPEYLDMKFIKGVEFKFNLSVNGVEFLKKLLTSFFFLLLLPLRILFTSYGYIEKGIQIVDYDIFSFSRFKYRHLGMLSIMLMFSIWVFVWSRY